MITSSNTFFATAEAISYTGALPVFADILPETANVDPEAVERAITERTRAIVPVHLYGRPAELEAILESGESAPTRGSRGRMPGARCPLSRTPIGSFGLAAAFSFYPGKNLGAYGEGGALTTNDAEVAAFAREAARPRPD